MLMFILGIIKLILNYHNFMSHYIAVLAKDTCCVWPVLLGKTELSRELLITK
jgi:hypothetical protein